jgi:hypothetical protein
MFLVTYAVGQNANNWWTDIMLVQYFIRNIYQINSREGGSNVWSMTSVSRNEIYDLPDPHKDFRNLKKTAKWIRYFQADATLLNGIPMINDGRVDAYSIVAAGGTTVYAIHLLNIVFQFSCQNVGLEDWETYVLGDPALPDMARGQLNACKI